MAGHKSARKRRPLSRSGLQSSVIWVSLAIIVALPLIQTVNLWSSNRQTVRATEVRATDLANILAEHMRSVVGEVDASLKQLVLHSARVGGPTAPTDSWLPVLRSAMAGMSHLGSLSVVDSNGVIRHSTFTSLVGQSRKDQFIFRYFATNRASGIIADTPFRSLVDQRIIIPFGRRLEGAGGSFEGTVVATLLPDAFRDFYRSVDVGREGKIWLVHSTGLVLCSEPQLRESDDGFASLPPSIWEAVNRDGAGILRAALQPDGPSYLNAWRTLDEPPITIAVSFNLPEALRSWRRSLFLSIGWTLLLSLVLGAASFQLARQLAARAAAESTLIQRDHELLEAQRIAGLGSARITLPDMRVQLSPNLAAILELSGEPDALPLETLLERLTKPDRLALREAIESCRASRTRYEIEIRAQLANSGERILHSEGILDDEDGSILAIFADVTERRLAQQRASQDERMAALGRLTGGVAHDFNNLLTAIIGYGDLSLRRLGENESMRHDIEEIVNAGRRAAELTSQLLAFSRTQVLQPTVVDLNNIVTGIKNMLVRLIGENIELRSTLNPSLGRVKVDVGQLEQVITNLVVNARDAMPKGGKITIETANVELDETYSQTHTSVHPGSYVLLAISDTGTGIDKDLLPHIFEPFFTTKELGKGTGLGLATVYGIVKQSGGNIWVYSEPGNGTTFKIYLPRVAEPIETREASTPIVESLRGTETILVVEDQETVRKLVRKSLESQGYRVLEASSAESALLLFRQFEGTIHLLITDVVMPGMSGRELAQRMEDSWKEVRVLYMSGYSDDAIVHHGILDQSIPFLQKPFTPVALSRKVREVLDAH